MKLYNTVLYKDLKKRVSKADWPVARRALHDTVQERGAYSESNKCGVILDTSVDGAFRMALHDAGTRLLARYFAGRPVGR